MLQKNRLKLRDCLETFYAFVEDVHDSVDDLFWFCGVVRDQLVLLKYEIKSKKWFWILVRSEFFLQFLSDLLDNVEVSFFCSFFLDDAFINCGATLFFNVFLLVSVSY